MTARPVKLLAGIVAIMIVVSACQDDEIGVAEAHEQFCSDVEDYIESIGAYGGLFDDVELTVGDVKSARDELEPGLQAVMDAATVFQEAVAADPESGVSIDIVEPESVETVEEAEAAFADASDIDDRTPLVDAGVEFSSAAYALEVAWVRLFADAGCLDDDLEAKAEAQQWVADYVAAIQTDFRTLGYYDGDVDGIYGPMTVAAVEKFQEDQGLPVTGLVDPPTQMAVNTILGERESAQVGALQAILVATGHYNGPVDGQWSPEVEAALIALQEDLGVPGTGVVDAATLRALEAALEEAGQTPDLPTTTTPDEPITTAPPDEAPATTTTAPPAATTTAPPATTTTDPAPEVGGVLDVLAEAGQFGQFLALIDSAGLSEMLSGPGPFTVFAPTDEAFAATTLPSDPEALSSLVLHHVVEEELDGFDLQTTPSLATAEGGEIAVTVDQGLVVLDGVATVSITNVRGNNGIAHVVNSVLLPVE